MQRFRLSEKYKKILYVFFPLVLLLYPLRHMFVGVEWWDTGYNYANFVFMDRMDPMWLFSTYLGTALGHMFTLLPFGRTMVGLNIYTGLLVSVLALLGYYFFVRVVGISRWIAFWGEILAISFCWCPTALLYNYLTYLLMALGVFCLYRALTEDRNKQRHIYFICAGIFLGINVFTRFPNLAQMGLIVAVWVMAVLRKEKPGKVLLSTLYCIIGYIIGLVAGFTVIAIQYGGKAYIEGIVRLLSMPSEATDYTIRTMVERQFQNYLQNFHWLGYFVLIAMICMIGYSFFGEKLIWLKRICTVMVFYVGLKYLFGKNMFNMKYSTKLSFFQWSAFLLSATLVILTVVLVRNKFFSDKDKLLAGIAVLVILITPLGSNNHLYSSVNNLFMIAPFTLWMLMRFMKWLPQKWKKVSLEPVKLVLALMLCVITFQGVLFGVVYVFQEADGGENLYTRIENNGILKGMRTSPERAKLISEISAYVEEEGLQGTEVILYGNIPAMSYYLDMPFAISAWPDLRSYNLDIMRSDLQELCGRIEHQRYSKPVILLEATTAEEMTDAASKDEKLQLIAAMIEDYDYTASFQNEKFVLFRADRKEENR